MSFTVKVVEKTRTGDGGIPVGETYTDSETLFTCSQVRKYGGKVYCDVYDGQIIYDVQKVAQANEQTLYVMNSHGQTVATFHLS